MNPFSLMTSQVLRCYQNDFEIDGKQYTNYKLDIGIEAFRNTDRILSLSIDPDTVKRLNLLDPKEFYAYYSSPMIKITGDFQQNKGITRLIVLDLEIVTKKLDKPEVTK